MRAPDRGLRARGRYGPSGSLLPPARAFVCPVVHVVSLAVGARLEGLAVAYAKHRTALHQNAAAIKQVQNDADGAYFDLRPYRERFWSGECHDLIQGEVIVWHGWAHAIEQCEPDKDHEEEECGYWATAKLMDERREIKRDGARIRASITKIGNDLLRAQQ